MASILKAQLPGTNVGHPNTPFEGFSGKYLVTRDILSVQINPSACPRLVVIPAKSVVERKGASSAAGFVELIWEHRIHMIFEADLTRLNADGNGRQVAAPRLTT